MVPGVSLELTTYGLAIASLFPLELPRHSSPSHSLLFPISQCDLYNLCEPFHIVLVVILSHDHRPRFTNTDRDWNSHHPFREFSLVIILEYIAVARFVCLTPLFGISSKPIVRYVSRSSRGVLLVRSERSYREWLEGRAAKHWIGWPRSEVYKYDESTFCRLEKLYRSGAQEDLGKGWAKCQSWTGH